MDELQKTRGKGDREREKRSEGERQREDMYNSGFPFTSPNGMSEDLNG